MSPREDKAVLASGRDADDFGYFKLVSIAIASTLGIYFGLEFIRQSLMEYLVVVVLALIVCGCGAVTWLRHRRSLLTDGNAHPAVRRYRALLAEMATFEEKKRGVLETTLIPQLRELIEDKLPELIQRRDRYRLYWQQCSVARLEKDVADLTQRLSAETDEDIRRALERNLDIAHSTQRNFAAIEKTLKLYELQIASIDKHLENLESKLHILDFDEDVKIVAETIVHGIHCDIDDLERALVQIDTLQEGQEHTDDARER